MAEFIFRPPRKRAPGRIDPRRARALYEQAEVQSPLKVRVLCGYAYVFRRAGKAFIARGVLTIEVRSSSSIWAAFVEEIQIRLADWNTQFQGPRPLTYHFEWYLPDNGKRRFP